ncbi:M48 family metallopeptidase [uncultured Psychrobacter sp.]|uniref:M48 family metallopeptidase n=1 Tax=uncultured Psychrobacter sp. TaxID=259303 RepID=UPI00345AAB86
MTKTDFLVNTKAASLDSLRQRLAVAGIKLYIIKKRVKNINFRLKPYCLSISVPLSINTTQMVEAIARRVPWALDNHIKVLEQYQRKQRFDSESASADSATWLWGKPQTLSLNPDEKVAYYRQQLSDVLPALFDKWQPIVGTTANEVRIKKMHTRWGSCNTRARRIWLSVYLPAYPIECSEYVIVHELCHLHHANHSRAFWQTVATAMPDYQQWHDRLAGKSGHLD